MFNCLTSVIRSFKRVRFPFSHSEYRPSPHYLWAAAVWESAVCGLAQTLISNKQPQTGLPFECETYTRSRLALKRFFLLNCFSKWYLIKDIQYNYIIQTFTGPSVCIFILSVFSLLFPSTLRTVYLRHSCCVQVRSKKVGKKAVFYLWARRCSGDSTCVIWGELSQQCVQYRGLQPGSEWAAGHLLVATDCVF